MGSDFSLGGLKPPDYLKLKRGDMVEVDFCTKAKDEGVSGLTSRDAKVLGKWGEDCLIISWWPRGERTIVPWAAVRRVI